MLPTCVICHRKFKTPRRKGWQFVPTVCSDLCFYQWLSRKVGPKKGLPNDVIMERYRKAEGNFKSRWEERVFYKLIKYYEVEYEPYIFHSGKYLYIPDFYLPEKRIFIEVKGKWHDYNKFRYFAKRIPVILLDSFFLKGRLRWV